MIPAPAPSSQANNFLEWLAPNQWSELFKSLKPRESRFHKTARSSRLALSHTHTHTHAQISELLECAWVHTHHIPRTQICIQATDVNLHLTLSVFWCAHIAQFYCKNWRHAKCVYEFIQTTRYKSAPDIVHVFISTCDSILLPKYSTQTRLSKLHNLVAGLV